MALRFHFARPHEERPHLRPGVGLALGGGFARGFAHLGVLRLLEENRIPISCISGCGSGSILATAYAAGNSLDRIVEASRELRVHDFAGWRISRTGLGSNKRLAVLLDRLFGSQQFEGLAIPAAVVATDLGNGDPVVFTQGSLAEAVLASCAFPGLFEPVQIGTRHLVDGSLVAPVPARAARKLGAQVVVGVFVGVHDGESGAPKGFFHIVSRTVSAAQKSQSEAWERHADLVLRPNVQAVPWSGFEQVDELIEAGAVAARAALPQIRKLFVQVQQAVEPGREGEYLTAEALR